MVKNVGNFKDYVAAGQVSLAKLNLIYAENGAGKTTLARVLHSLSTGDGDVVMYSGGYPFSVPVIPVHFLGVKTDYLLRS